MLKDAAPSAIYLKDYRVPDFLIERTILLVDINDDATLVTATLQIEKNSQATSSSPALVLDGKELELVSLQLNDDDLAEEQYQVSPSQLTIADVPDSFQLIIKTRIYPQNNTSLEGLYKSGNKYCTQCEAEGFRAITYYLDRPDVMSVFTTTIVADKQKYPVLLSNGNAMEKGETDDGRHWQTWHDPFKKPSYLFALVAGNLVSVDDTFVTQSGRTIELKLYVEEKDINKCDHAITCLKNAMLWDERVYGREYDLDLFMIVAVDDFNMGAMENKGLNIFNTSCVLADPDITTDAGFQRVETVVAHEYFHNWSGNRVTCRDWFQLSLKEGFTVFRDSQFSADMGSPTVKRVEDVNLLRTLQFAEDAGPLAHPVQPPSFIEISNFYTLTIYEKGAEIVRMIYNLLGPDMFRQGSDLYFERHDGQAVTINEFTQAMEAVSGKDLTQFKRWYTQAGTPEVEVTDNYNAETKQYTLKFTQNCRPTAEEKNKQPFHIPVAMGLVGKNGELAMDGNTHAVLELKEPEQQFVFNNINEKPVPALLRGFSAPVRLRYNYSRDDLVRLITLDSDGFTRWNAMQELAASVINDLINHLPNINNQTLDTSISHVFLHLLKDETLDKAMVALTLQLPSEAYLSEQAEIIDVDGIHGGREWLQNSLANSCEKELLAVYQSLNVKTEYQPTADQIAQRSLKNVSLHYLATLQSPDYVDLCYQQYQSASNMTDRLSALRYLVNSPVTSAKEKADECLSHFYKRFSNEPLAIDQWLAVQATSTGKNALDNVKALLQHECFSLKNPNKVRSLIGAFCNNNLINFHRLDGSGYDFLTEQIIALNKLNPQIASRLVTPLTRWRKYSPERQSLMTERLKNIASQSDLSKDVFEVVSKSLNAE